MNPNVPPPSPSTDDDGQVKNEVEQMSVDEAFHAAEAMESNGRNWIKTLTPLLQVLCVRTETWSQDEDVSAAIDDLIVAACRRAARILRADVAT